MVIASLPAGQYGTTIAATTANALRFSLPHIRFGLMVGIGAGVPQLERGEDVRLGDIVVSQPYESSGGVIQYDLVKARQDGHFLTGYLAMPPEVLLKSLGKLQAEHEMRDSTVPSILKATLLKFPKMTKRTAKDPGYAYPGAESDLCSPKPSLQWLKLQRMSRSRRGSARPTRYDRPGDSLRRHCLRQHPSQNRSRTRRDPQEIARESPQQMSVH